MSKFRAIKTPIDGLIVLEPTVFGDNRGFFMETYSQRDFEEAGIDSAFVQDNHSKSKKGVLRGMHFQKEHTQGKLIRVIAGAVYDVAVDLREESPTYGKWYGIELTGENKLQFWIPPRFAHGFLSLEENTEFVYKCTDYYHPESDSGVRWNDPEISIDWKLETYGILFSELTLSDKDKTQPLLNELDKHNLFKK